MLSSSEGNILEDEGAVNILQVRGGGVLSSSEGNILEDEGAVNILQVRGGGIHGCSVKGGRATSCR